MPGRASDDRESVVCVSGRRVVDVLAGMDVRTVLLGDPTPLELACLADVPVDVDLDDWTAVETAVGRLHEDRRLTAVLGVYDAHLPLAGYLAARLGIRGLSLAATLNCADKARMRLTLDGSGVRGPDHLVADDPADVASACRRIGFPVVLKKTVGGGGRGAFACGGVSDVAVAVDTLGGGSLLVERYIDGPEYAVQAVVVDGAVDIIGVLAQHVGPGPRQPEVGYDFPSGLGAAGDRAIGRFVGDALRALGFDDGIAHVQVRIGPDGPMIVNVAPRPPGGQLCALTEQVSGVDMTRAAVEVALGRRVARRPPSSTHALYRCVTFETSGLVDYEPAALDLPGVFMDVEPGEYVHAVGHPQGGSYGRIVLYGDDLDRLRSDYRQRLAALRPRVVSSP